MQAEAAARAALRHVEMQKRGERSAMIGNGSGAVQMARAGAGRDRGKEDREVTADVAVAGGSGRVCTRGQLTQRAQWSSHPPDIERTVRAQRKFTEKRSGSRAQQRTHTQQTQIERSSGRHSNSNSTAKQELVDSLRSDPIRSDTIRCTVWRYTEEKSSQKTADVTCD